MARDDGVPAELRERIARRYFGVLYADKGVEHEFTIAATHYYAVTDAILAEIERAGYAIVDAGRLERLMCLAKIGAAGCSIVRPAVGEEPQWMCRCDPLQTGDLGGTS